MTIDRQRVAADFDVRAANYSRNQWHRVYAEGLIAHSTIRNGDRLLDAGVGSGFAAIAAAIRVGADGHVLGVDLSAGMLANGDRDGASSNRGMSPSRCL